MPLSKQFRKGPFWKINSVRKKQLKAALLDFDSVPVYTIHGFCKRVLREFAFENRQLFEQQLCDTNLLFPEVFRRYIRRELLSRNTPVSQLFALYVKHAEGNLDSLESDINVLLSKDGKFIPLLPQFDVFLKKFKKTWNTLTSRDLSLRKQNAAQHPIRTAFESTALRRGSKNKTLRNLELLLETLGEAHSGATILENLLDVFQIELETVEKPKCRKTLTSGEQWLSTEEFPEQERKWIAAVEDCEKLLQGYNFSGSVKKILKAWLIQQVLEDVCRELDTKKTGTGKI